MDQMMEVYVNGEVKRLPSGTSAADLLLMIGLTGHRLAMEINREIVPRSAFEDRRLQPGDRVEIVHAIGGG